jgi:hypothetical protein
MNFWIQRSRLLLLGGAGTALGLAGVFAPLPVAAQAAEPMIYTVGLTRESGGQHWAYLHWRSTAFDLFTPRTWSVWRKDGHPQSPGNYTLEAVVQVQSSPAALGALLDRARLHLGEDTSATRTALTELFDDLIPDGTLTDAEVASAVIQGVAANPEFLDSLQFAMRTFPSMAMALGTAHALPIPSSGPVTFEIRYRASPTAPDEGVVGRVTVDAAAPLVLPAPGPLTLAPPEPGRPATSDLAIPLRWATPDPLRRLALAQHGFNLWRVQRAFAENLGWHTTPPPAEHLVALVDTPNGPVGRVNQAPILPRRTLNAAEAASADHTIVFATDHESRFPGYPHTHTPPQNGDQYYYFLTARDLLGRDGAVSMGLLGTFCSKLPPRVPIILAVDNDYVFDPGPKHHLRVRWAANPPEQDKRTTAYALYRWASTAQMNQLGGDPMANLVAIIPHTSGPAEFSYLDVGPGSPTAPADLTKTFWYTLRAIDDSGEAGDCGAPPFNGNLSGHSPPVPGVLRDRVGPLAPGGGIRMRCAEPMVEIQRELPPDYEPAAPIASNLINVDILIERLNLDPNLAWVEVSWGVGAAELLIGRFEFQPEQTRIVHRLTFPANTQGGQIWVRATAATLGDSVAVSDQLFFNLPAPGPFVDVAVAIIAGVAYTQGMVDPFSGRRPCDAHVTIPPEAGGTDDDGLEIVIFPAPDMRQYKLYFRIDDGPLTLLREASGQFDPATPITELWLSTPLYAGEACFFVQGFDRHGNPSPLEPLGCISLNFKFPPPAPRLAPIIPGGTAENPTARIQWFSPRWGISRFQVWIRGLPTTLPPNWPDTLGSPGIALIGGKSYRTYLTPDVAAGFGNGSLFEVEIPLPADASFEVRVRGFTVSGGNTQLSNLEEFEWTAPEDYHAPDVPWPRRPMPFTQPAAQFNPRIIAKAHPEGGGMVRIGELIDDIIHFPEQDKFLVVRAGDPTPGIYVRTGAGEIRSLFPFVLYRTMVESPAFPQVSGDVYQVSPLMEDIAWRPETDGAAIYDPFIYLERPLNGQVPTPTNPVFMYLVDTQPAISRAIYRYFLVLLHPETGEIEEILATNDAQL